MIDIRALRKLAGNTQQHVDIDDAGALVVRGPLDSDGPAILIAAPVTDAVKVIAEGLILDSLDRERLWSVQGFRLDPEVVLVLDDTVSDPQSLLDAVTAAGFEWQVVKPDDRGLVTP